MAGDGSDTPMREQREQSTPPHLHPLNPAQTQTQAEADNELMSSTNPNTTATNTAGNSPLVSSANLPHTHPADSVPPEAISPVRSQPGGRSQEVINTQGGTDGSAPSPQSQPLTSTPMTSNPPPEMTFPSTQLTFLLVSGKRRTMSFEPDTTIGRVKELVWNAWPADWQSERAPAPSYFRILYLGKILQDEDTLSSHKFRTTPAPPTIVHLSVRQVPLLSEQEAMKKSKKRARMSSSGGDADESNRNGREDGMEEEGGCCGCVIS